MRILLTTESYLPYLSGVTVSVDALARGLGARGHQVLVLAPAPRGAADPGPAGSPGPAPRHAWLASYQLPRAVPAGYRMPWPLPASSAVREANRFAPDLVHAHSPFVSGLMAGRIARASGVPLVFTHHTRFGDYAHYLGPFAGPASRLVEAYLRRYWRRCAAIVAPSSDLASEIAARLPAGRRDRVCVIPTGVDVAGIRAGGSVDLRATIGWPPGAIVAASLGRLAPEKSPTLVLDAFQLAATAEPRLRLLVVGGGPSEPALRARAERANLAGRVHFTGLLPRPAALRTVAGADVFVFVSRTETQGLVLAEALSTGLPAVAVDGPGVRDSVRDGVDGLVVAAMPAPGRAERVADGLLSIIRQPGRLEDMAARARRDADRFSVEARVADTEALYRSLVA